MDLQYKKALSLLKSLFDYDLKKTHEEEMVIKFPAAVTVDDVLADYKTYLDKSIKSFVARKPALTYINTVRKVMNKNYDEYLYDNELANFEKIRDETPGGQLLSVVAHPMVLIRLLDALSQAPYDGTGRNDRRLRKEKKRLTIFFTENFAKFGGDDEAQICLAYENFLNTGENDTEQSEASVSSAGDENGAINPNGASDPNDAINPNGASDPNDAINLNGASDPNDAINPNGASDPNGPINPNYTSDTNCASKATGAEESEVPAVDAGDVVVLWEYTGEALVAWQYTGEVGVGEESEAPEASGIGEVVVDEESEAPETSGAGDSGFDVKSFIAAKILERRNENICTDFPPGVDVFGNKIEVAPAAGQSAPSGFIPHIIPDSDASDDSESDSTYTRPNYLDADGKIIPWVAFDYKKEGYCNTSDEEKELSPDDSSDGFNDTTESSDDDL